VSETVFIPPSVADATRFREAIRRIDAENERDPRGFELPYARRLTAWVKELSPAASEALAIAARGQHIARWEIPRERYPEGLKGYTQWRETLKQFHAEKLDGILRACGYGDDSISQVRALVTKERLPEDPEAQVIEDALCLAFLELQLAEFIGKHPREKSLDIVRKTWGKMSVAGRSEALRMKLAPDAATLVREATA
jgi:hypothetical protein